MGQALSSRTQRNDLNHENAAIESSSSEASASRPTQHRDTSKRRIWSRSSSSSKAVPLSVNVPVRSSTKPAHFRSDSSATIIASTSKEAYTDEDNAGLSSSKRRRWSLSKRSISSASTQTVLEEPESSQARTRGFMRRRMSRQSSSGTYRGSEPALVEADVPIFASPTEEEVPEETLTPCSEASDPLAEERKRAEETIAAALAQLRPAPVEEPQEEPPDPRIRLTNDDDDLDPYVSGLFKLAQTFDHMLFADLYKLSPSPMNPEISLYSLPCHRYQLYSRRLCQMGFQLLYLCLQMHQIRQG